ncbi:unnamed protein product, partial [Brassica oleracea]
MEILKGELHHATGFNGFIIPLEVINSVLVPTVDEETLLARIIDLEPEYHREGSTSDRWNY